jgi:hypothetical protein
LKKDSSSLHFVGNRRFGVANDKGFRFVRLRKLSLQALHMSYGIVLDYRAFVIGLVIGILLGSRPCNLFKHSIKGIGGTKATFFG